MTANIDIYRTANELIKQHGDDAPKIGRIKMAKATKKKANPKPKTPVNAKAKRKPRKNPLSKRQQKYLVSLKKTMWPKNIATIKAIFLKDAKEKAVKPVAVDKVAKQIEARLASLNLRLGNKGYTVKRAKGKNAKGYIAKKN